MAYNHKDAIKRAQLKLKLRIILYKKQGRVADCDKIQRRIDRIAKST